MELEIAKTPIAELRPGMYVSMLDRPWLDTPFPFQGFVITEEDIDILARYCQHVFVDLEKSQLRPTANKPHHKPDAPLFNPTKVKVYPKETSREEETRAAHKAHKALGDAYQRVLEELNQNRKLSVPLLKEAVLPMVDSVIRNPDALLLLTRLKKMDSYAYQHAMSCAVLAVATGRQIGLPKPMLRDLAMGGALFDIGRMRIPEAILSRPKRLSEDDMALVRQHVQFSIEALENNDHISAEVVQMIATHHERYDGSGYPAGLRGDAIPLFGRIAGIVDSYDAITSDRPHATQLTPDAALRMIYEWRDLEFHGALVEQFIQVIGVYPVGTIVELSDGRVGIVSGQHPEARLRPMVMVVLEKDKQPPADYYEFDMRNHRQGEDGKPLSIHRSLPAGSHDIDPVDYFVLPTA
ncbi:MAG: HD-GYP domain-containing protein [Chromatiales bacterium]|nr:HD-GYP domain-containing protein [Gammaproteobacteria bacterium]MBW6477283.1 HD-GYP domain-containing protein [Chromatiales bacterium]